MRGVKRKWKKLKKRRKCNMISISDTFGIPLIACSLVYVGIFLWYPKYWKDHKISIFGTIGIATFVWAMHMNNILSHMKIFVLAIVALTAISICDVLYTYKREEVELKACKEEV